jgi:hypothetical protein
MGELPGGLQECSEGDTLALRTRWVVVGWESVGECLLSRRLRGFYDALTAD